MTRDPTQAGHPSRAAGGLALSDPALGCGLLALAVRCLFLVSEDPAAVPMRALMPATGSGLVAALVLSAAGVALTARAAVGLWHRRAGWYAGILLAVAWPAVPTFLAGPRVVLPALLLPALLLPAPGPPGALRPRLFPPRGVAGSLLWSLGVAMALTAWLAVDLSFGGEGLVGADNPARLRSLSPWLRLPIWPGWGLLAGLAGLGCFVVCGNPVCGSGDALSRGPVPGRSGGQPACRAVGVGDGRWRWAVVAAGAAAVLLLRGVDPIAWSSWLVLLAMPAGAGLDVLVRELPRGRWPLGRAAPLLSIGLMLAVEFGGPHLMRSRETTAADPVWRLAVLREWVWREPDHADSRVRLAAALLDSGALDEAAVQLDLALRSDPAHRGGQLVSARLLRESGNAGAALRRYQELARVERDAEVLLGLARCQRILGRPDQAAAALRELLTREPRHAEAAALLADLEPGAGQGL